MGLLLGCSGSGATPGSAPSGASPTQVITSVDLGQTHTGQATFYTTADGSGACSYDKNPADPNIAALNISDWAGSAWCGACVDITGPMGDKLRVRIVDECPDCDPGQLDLHPDAFAKLAPTSEGRIDITWSFVACDVTGPVTYKYKDGSNAYWTALQVGNSRLPVTVLESSPDGSTWKGTVRQDYNYFLDDQGFGSGAVHVRITALDGQMLEDTLPAVQELLVTPGHAQFQ